MGMSPFGFDGASILQTVLKSISGEFAFRIAIACLVNTVLSAFQALIMLRSYSTANTLVERRAFNAHVFPGYRH